VIELVARIERDIAPIEVAVFNVGGNVRFGITRPPRRSIEKSGRWVASPASWLGAKSRKRCCRASRARSCSRADGQPARLGRLAAFAGAKHGLRSLAQSMARELGPQGIHVAHVVIDGAIDTPFIAERFPERYALKTQDGILNPDAIAENYWQLHGQHRSA